MSVNDPEIVLESPDLMVLFFKVSVVSVPTKVVVASGKVMVLSVDVGVQVKVPLTPAEFKTNCLEDEDKLKEANVGVEVADRSWSKVTLPPLTVKVLGVVPPETLNPSFSEAKEMPLMFLPAVTISPLMVKVPLISMSELTSK